MKTTPHIHSLRIDFQITPTLARFVYIHILEGKQLYLVDAGVAGAEQAVVDYLESIGRNISEVAAIFLTHSHPDHIGGAAAIRELSSCTIYGPAAERDWIEDIDCQFRNRPIPNFYNLLNRSVPIDIFPEPGTPIVCEPGITLDALNTPGHSHGSLSYLFLEEKALITGDAVPVAGDIPIYVDPIQSIKTLRNLLSLKDISWYLSAWADIQDAVTGPQAIRTALEFQENIAALTKEYISRRPETDNDTLIQAICSALHLEHFADNPLLKRSLSTNIATARKATVNIVPRE